jgi:hypothetical protein
MAVNKQKSIILFILILVAAGTTIWLRSHFLNGIGVSIQQKIQALKLSGFNIRYDSLSIDWLGNVIEIDQLLLEKDPYDTMCVYPEFIKVGKARAEGLGLFSLIFRDVLTFDYVYLDGARIIMRENSLLKLDSAAQRENEFTLRIDHVLLRSIDFTYTDSLHCEVISAFKSDVTIDKLEMDFHLEKPLSYQARRLIIDSAEINLPRQFYTFTIKRAEYDFIAESLQGDSIRIHPTLGKLEFGRKWGHEIDRFEAMIPFVKANDVRMSFIDSTTLTAGGVQIQMYLKVFRDKRLRFVKKVKLLPMDQLAELPFGLSIDSLKVIKSYVEYEEFPEGGGTETGRVYFDNLYATLLNIDNRNPVRNTLLSAQSNLLGEGKLNLYVTFPADKSKRSSAAGTIKNFNMPEINSMLVPATNIKVESGKMKELSFNFTFNAVRSDGELELNYENLKLITFKDSPDKGDALEKDNLKSFIMNTFIFRKNMDEDVPEEKRTGAVAYVRDDSRSVFNFWVKSVVSGIKSAYNLDKTEAKMTGKKEKKEERLTRRAQRKIRKAEKKRERG